MIWIYIYCEVITIVSLVNIHHGKNIIQVHIAYEMYERVEAFWYVKLLWCIFKQQS